MPQIDQFLKLMLDQKASDLHLTVGSQPVMRQHGELTRIKFRELSQTDMQALLYEIMTPEQRSEFEERIAAAAEEVRGLDDKEMERLLERKLESF